MAKRTTDKNKRRKAQKSWKKFIQNNIEKKDSKGALKELFKVSTDIEKKILGELFYEVFNWYKFHPDEPVKNIIFCTAKSVRKTKMVFFKIIIEMFRNDWLDAIHLRRTGDIANQEGRKQMLDSASILSREYGLTMIDDMLKSFSTGIYLVKDRTNKNNQVMEFDSFSGIVAKGGFPNQYIMHFEELVNPNNANKVISMNKKEDLRKEFIANLKFVEMKNNDNFITSGYDRFKLGATNYFTFNRYDENEPALEFCEEYAPFKPVQKWFESDIQNNTVYVKYIKKVDKRWRGLERTLIVYATKFSNHLLTRNKDWVEETLNILKDRNKEDMAIIIGTLYDGYTKSDAMTYTQKNLPIIDYEIGEPVEFSVGIDIDYREEICIQPKYLMKIWNKKIFKKYKRPIYYVLRQESIIYSAGKDKIPYQVAEEWISYQTGKLFKNRRCKPFFLWIDDDTGAMQNGVQRNNNFKFNAYLAVKKGEKNCWDIISRQEYMDMANHCGFETSIKLNERLNKDYLSCVNSEQKDINEKTPKRDELKGRNVLNLINADEYASYQFATNLKNFPLNFWKWYFSEHMVK